ncbi:MAG: hypothetical protein Q7V63_06735 [Gammaproteobacteria bacterium]|nr:hypothetical protein [Gammaproteobacteria bacterium]
MHGSVINLTVFRAFIGNLYGKAIPAHISQFITVPTNITEKSIVDLHTMAAGLPATDPVTTALKKFIKLLNPAQLNDLWLLSKAQLQKLFTSKECIEDVIRHVSNTKKIADFKKTVELLLNLTEHYKAPRALHTATSQGFHSTMKKMISDKVNVNEKTLLIEKSTGTSILCNPLFFALNNCDLGAITILINSGANLELWHEAGYLDASKYFIHTHSIPDFLPKLVEYRDALKSSPSEAKLTEMEPYLEIANFLNEHGAEIDLSFVERAKEKIAEQEKLAIIKQNIRLAVPDLHIPTDKPLIYSIINMLSDDEQYAAFVSAHKGSRQKTFGALLDYTFYLRQEGQCLTAKDLEKIQNLVCRNASIYNTERVCFVIALNGTFTTQHYRDPISTRELIEGLVRPVIQANKDTIKTARLLLKMAKHFSQCVLETKGKICVTPFLDAEIDSALVEARCGAGVMVTTPSSGHAP